MKPNDDIVFESNSGISIEEQKEILLKINSISENHRSSLSEGDKTLVKAKKSGLGFPLIVNILAIIIFCAGAVLLILINKGIDIQRRTGDAVFNETERAVINEIRRDTAQRIAEKDREIAFITARMAEIDEQLLLLFAGSGSLTIEQLEDQERLLSMQIIFRNDLHTLQMERAHILEESRAMEEILRSQLAERTRAWQLTTMELDSAMLEIENLRTERDRLAAMDALIAGGLSLTGTPAHTGSEEDVLQLQEQITQLQITINEMQSTIDLLSSTDDAGARRTIELEGTVSSMRGTIASLEQAAQARDNEIAALEDERSSLQSINTIQEQEIANLRNQINVIREMLLDNE